MHISNELRVGIMFFAGLALLVLLIATLTRWGQTRNAYSFIIRFDQAQGIQSGADVRVSGVKVGQVSDVSLDPATSAALVTVRVDKRVNLYQGYKFSIGLGGLVGERYIEITPSVTRTARIGPGSKVDGNESTDINQLLGSANTVMTKLSTTADALNAIMGDEATQQHFKRAVADIQKTATSSSQFAEQLNQMARTNRGAIDLVMANLGDVSSDIRRVSDSLSPQLESSKVFSNLDAASKNAVVITERLGRITDAVDTMLNDKTITMNLRDTVSHLRDASANL
ncbi:MAG TPA: MlaD family protein, partial [Armatimonadota bacterium]|nr:MlaD family protein [Armatimonadota bacterium]